MKLSSIISIFCGLLIAGTPKVSHTQSANGTPVGVTMGTQTIQGKQATRVVVDFTISNFHKNKRGWPGRVCAAVRKKHLCISSCTGMRHCYNMLDKPYSFADKRGILD